MNIHLILKKRILKIFGFSKYNKEFNKKRNLKIFKKNIEGIEIPERKNKFNKLIFSDNG